MSNKRVMVRQERQKKKQRKQITIIVLCVCVLAVAAIFTVYGVNSYNMGSIMTYEGERIGISDFQFSLLASEGADDPKAAALTQLLESLTLLKHAETENITLTDAENDELDQYVSNFKSVFGQTYGLDFSFISDERIKALLSSDTLYARFLGEYTSDYAVDEADYATKLADYKENSKASYYDVGLKYIVTQTQEQMDEVKTNLETRPFDDVWKEFSADYQEGSEIVTNELKNMTLPAELTEEILGLEAGGRTESYEVSEGSFFIFEVVSYSIPPQSEVEENYRELYTSEQKNTVFREILDGWVADAQYELNQKAYDAA